MATRARRKPELLIFGLRPETLQEAGGIILFLLGLGLLLAVVSVDRGDNLIGPLGAATAHFLCFYFGLLLAYLLPAALMTMGVAAFRGWKLRHPFVFVFGFILLTFSIAGLTALTTARLGTAETTRFAWAGALGVFLVHPDFGLRLTHWLNFWGAGVALTGGTLIGLLLTTNLLFRTLLRGVGALAAGSKNVVCKVLPWVARIKLPKFRLPDFSRDDKYLRERCFNNVNRGLLDSPMGEALPNHHDLEIIIDNDQAVIEIEEKAAARGADEPAELAAQTTARRGAAKKPAAEAEPFDDALVQEEFDVFQGYQLPSLSILSDPPVNEERMSNQELVELSERLEQALNEFNISSQVVKVTQGPTVTMFELRTAPGVKVSRITSLENDIAMALKAISVRILAPVPGRGTVGIEVPNSKPSVVYVKEVLVSDKFQKMRKPLAFALGKTVQGDPVVCDLAKMPHLLIAGATGSGKSVCLNSIICSLLFTQKPDRVKFLMIDPKKVELNVYQEIPHLLAPVVSDPRKAASALAWIVAEMEDRYERLKLIGERNIDAYNQVAQGEKPLHSLAAGNDRKITYMPFIIVVIDELADLMLMCRKEVEENIARLAQMSRAVGIHLILATQRPSVNVITGIIKANFPTRVAFQVASQVDSKTILDGKGAESLLGQGDMLFLGGNQRKATRIQGTYVADDEVETLTNFIRGQECVQYIAADFQPLPETPRAEEADADYDEAHGNELDPASSPSAIAASIPLEDLQRPAEEVAPLRANARQTSPLPGVPAPADAPAPQKVVKTTHYMVEDFPNAGALEAELDDELFRDALQLILTTKKASVSMIQRKLKIGYARAGRLMDIIEAKGIVGPYCGSKPRAFLVDPEEALARFNNGQL